MIPNYRIRIYCCIGALFCLIVALACAEQLHNAATLGQFDVTTGRGGAFPKSASTWSSINSRGASVFIC